MYLLIYFCLFQSIDLVPINHSNYLFQYIVNGFPLILVCYHNILEPCLGPVSTINYKTPPVHPCNVVFNLKSPLGDTKPNDFSPAFLCFPATESEHFYYCEPISKVKQRIFSYKELVTFVNN